MARKRSRIRARGRYSPRNRGVKTRAQRMAKNRIGTGTPRNPQRSIKSIRASSLKRIRDNARERNEKFKQTRVQTFGGKKTRFTKKEEARIKDAGYKVAGYSKAKFKPKAKPKVNAVGRNELKTGGTDIARYGLLPSGEHGPFEDGTRSKFGEGTPVEKEYIYREGKGFIPFTEKASLGIGDNTLTARNQGPVSNIRYDSSTGRMEYYGGATGVKGTRLKKPLPGPDLKLTASNLTGLTGLSSAVPKSTGFTPSIPGLAESLGLDPNTGQEVSSTPTSGGLNIGSQRTTNKTRRGRTSRGIRIGGSASAKPTVQEEVLLPVEQPVQTASTTPATTTGVNPNRLLEIQQQAYAQAYNPMLIGGFNPQFRFGAAPPTIDYSTYFNY